MRTQLVREHGHDLALLALLEQRVVQDDAHPRQPRQAIPARQQQISPGFWAKPRT